MRNFAILLAVDCLGTNTVSNMIPFANQVCVEAESKYYFDVLLFVTTLKI